MKKKWVILAVVAIAAFSYYTWLNNRTVTIIDTHYNEYTAEILVNHLPVSQLASIDWWLENQAKIRSEYNIPPDETGPYFITLYAFNDGYKEEGKEDRLCFDDMAPPVNCIDKDILMMLHRTRDGDTEFSFTYDSYRQTKDGKIVKFQRK